MASKKVSLVSEVVPAEAEVAVVGAKVSDWGQSSYSASDIVIPRILLMQGTSKLVADGKMMVASIVDSMNEKVLGNPDKPLSIIPFHMSKSWSVSEKLEGQWKWIRRDVWTPANDGQAWEQTIGGKEFKFEKTYDFYVLLEADTTLPYVLSMKSTSARAAKELATQMYSKNRMAGLVPPGKVIKLSVERVVKEDKKYAVYKTSVEKDTPQELIAIAFKWFNSIQAGQVKEHEVKEDSEVNSTPGTFSASDIESGQF